MGLVCSSGSSLKPFCFSLACASALLSPSADASSRDLTTSSGRLPSSLFESCWGRTFEDDPCDFHPLFRRYVYVLEVDARSDLLKSSPRGKKNWGRASIESIGVVHPLP